MKVRKNCIHDLHLQGIVGLLASAFLLIPLIGRPQENPLETYYEKSGFKETPRYDKTIRYCKQLAQNSPWVHYTQFGVSLQGRALPLVIVDKKGNFDPQAVHATKNAVVLIQACIHAGEPDGKDAGLMLIRDMTINKKYEDLLDNVTLLFIPILNVDGHERFGPDNRINQNGPQEMGWRTNAMNLNLNRDYLKAESPEIQSWLRLFQEWMPDFFIDCHVTDGADYQYPLTYGMETSGAMDPSLTQWQTQSFIQTVETKMKEAGYPIISYVSFRNWHDPGSGLETWASPPMFSQGYCAVQNRPSLLIETHMLKDYHTRVSATYEMLKQSMAVINRDYRRLIDLVQEADKNALQLGKQGNFPVKYTLSKTDSVLIDFQGYEYQMIVSDLTGGNWFQYSDKPVTLKIPSFEKVNPELSVRPPLAYIIPVEWKEVIGRLSLHGITYFTLPRETKVRVSSYRFWDVTFRNTPYEGHQLPTFQCDSIAEERTYPSGSVVVEMNQRTSKVIAYLLEPMAASSLAYWGYFNTLFEQKEYSESYVMEKMAREMIAKDPGLLEQLKQKKDSDPDFAKNPSRILNWFYMKTPYWDSQKDLYPVGRIFDPAVIENLKK